MKIIISENKTNKLADSLIKRIEEIGFDKVLLDLFNDNINSMLNVVNLNPILKEYVNNILKGYGVIRFNNNKTKLRVNFDILNIEIIDEFITEIPIDLKLDFGDLDNNEIFEIKKWLFLVLEDMDMDLTINPNLTHDDTNIYPIIYKINGEDQSNELRNHSQVLNDKEIYEIMKKGGII
jgi:hypothetical protein